MKLPLECEAEYFKDFMEPHERDELFFELLELVKGQNYSPETETDKTYVVNFGKMMFLDQNLLDNNSFPTKQWGPTQAWTSKLGKLKKKIESSTSHSFQVCVLIYYPDGHAGVDFHSDYVAFGDTSLIPSISLGQEREFKFRHKESGEEFVTTLEDGSLVIMGEHCQDRYEHSLPINPKYKNPRINLTFRKYGFDQ